MNSNKNQIDRERQELETGRTQIKAKDDKLKFDGHEHQKVMEELNQALCGPYNQSIKDCNNTQCNQEQTNTLDKFVSVGYVVIEEIGT